MSFDAGQITGRLGLDLSGFTGGVLKAEGLSRVLGATFSTLLAHPLLGLVAIAVQAGRALVGMVTGTATSADQLNKLSRATGMTIEFLSGMRHAADLSGTSIDAVRTSLATMTRNMSGESAAAFASLGVSVKDGSGQLRNAQAVFLDVADKMAGMDNETQRAAVALDIFGRSAQQMIPLLASGKTGIEAMVAEAGELGLVFDTQAGAAAERFNDALTRMAAVFKGMAQKVGMPLLEALGPLLEALIPPLKLVADILGGIIKVLTAPITAIAGLFAGPAGGAKPAGGGNLNVNVTVDPEASADGVARKVAPAIARAARGVQGDIEASSRRNMDLRDWTVAATLRAT